MFWVIGQSPTKGSFTMIYAIMKIVPGGDVKAIGYHEVLERVQEELDRYRINQPDEAFYYTEIEQIRDWKRPFGVRISPEDFSAVITVAPKDEGWGEIQFEDEAFYVTVQAMGFQDAAYIAKDLLLNAVRSGYSWTAEFQNVIVGR